jgi:hypothetical protein
MEQTHNSVVTSMEDPRSSEGGVSTAKGGAGEPSNSSNSSKPPDSQEPGSPTAEDNDSNDDELMALFRKHTNAELAKQLFDTFQGKLEYVPLQEIPLTENIYNLSLIDLLEFETTNYEIKRMISSCKSLENSESAFSKEVLADTADGRGSTASDGPNDLSMNQGQGIQPLATGQGDGNGHSSGTRDRGSQNTSRANHSNRLQASGPITRFRCPYHAFSPELFCGTGDKKYRTCQGPGWKTIQALK